MLDEEATFVVVVDALRSIEVTPTSDGETVVMAVQDPVCIAVVELTQSELDELITGLTRLKK